MRMGKLRIFGLLMLAAAVAFVAYALQHPEGNFPWSGNVTRAIYGVYVIVMVVFIVSPGGRRKVK